jgi:hypothetical protein
MTNDELLEKYPSPRPDKKKFSDYWNQYLVDIKDRQNLKPAHLLQLKILCDLAVEYDQLVDTIDLRGRTYESEGRNGLQIKLRPEIAQLKICQSEIRNYSKILGLILSQDQELTNTKGETNEFED